MVNIGFIAVILAIIYVYKRIAEIHSYKDSDFYESKKVYKAASEFANGASSDEVKNILTNSVEFDEEDADNVLADLSSHRLDEDGGYREFIKSVNKVLGADVYRECYRIQ